MTLQVGEGHSNIILVGRTRVWDIIGPSSRPGSQHVMVELDDPIITLRIHCVRLRVEDAGGRCLSNAEHATNVHMLKGRVRRGRKVARSSITDTLKVLGPTQL